MNTVTRQASPGRVLVAGGTSQVGVFLLPRLLAQDFSVLALSRRIAVGDCLPLCSGQLRWLHPDDAAGLVSARSEHTPGGAAGETFTLISCGPIDIASRLVSSGPKLRRVICLSTSSTLTKQFSDDAGERQQIRAILDAENELQSACRQRDIPLALLRPTMIYGCGRDQNISRLANIIRRFGMLPLAGAAAGLRQPVHADDLAAALAALACREGLASLDCTVSGGEVLTYRELVCRIFAALDLPVRIIGLPAGLLVLAFRLSRLLPGLPALSAEQVRRQNHDMVFDSNELQQVIDYQPRPFHLTVADFDLPAAAAALQPPNRNR